jgi:hypothetical protein
MQKEGLTRRVFLRTVVIAGAGALAAACGAPPPPTPTRIPTPTRVGDHPAERDAARDMGINEVSVYPIRVELDLEYPTGNSSVGYLSLGMAKEAKLQATKKLDAGSSSQNEGKYWYSKLLDGDEQTIAVNRWLDGIRIGIKGVNRTIKDQVGVSDAVQQEINWAFLGEWGDIKTDAYQVFEKPPEGEVKPYVDKRRVAIQSKGYLGYGRKAWEIVRKNQFYELSFFAPPYNGIETEDNIRVRYGVENIDGIIKTGIQGEQSKTDSAAAVSKNPNIIKYTADAIPAEVYRCFASGGTPPLPISEFRMAQNDTKRKYLPILEKALANANQAKPSYCVMKGQDAFGVGFTAFLDISSDGKISFSQIIEDKEEDRGLLREESFELREVKEAKIYIIPQTTGK